jgi:hypothetical protein
MTKSILEFKVDSFKSKCYPRPHISVSGSKAESIICSAWESWFTDWSEETGTHNGESKELMRPEDSSGHTSR